MNKPLRYASWRSFHVQFLLEYVQQVPSRRSRLIFRGHGDAQWKLSSTLDRRSQPFQTDDERTKYYKELLHAFSREAIRLSTLPDISAASLAFELLARHHGIPSPIIDWTESPYVAAYFAFGDQAALRTKHVAIWMLDLSEYRHDPDLLEIIEDPELIRLNRRALRQRGIFTYVKSICESVEDFLGVALTKIEISANQRSIALRDLDEMLINSATLFDDLDSVARTVVTRHELLSEGQR